jgi:DNA invertase Pin-like site-specific DNA recombinase
MVAEMERRFILERQRTGIEAAKAEGRYHGRKPTIDPEAVARLKAEGLGASDIARTLGIGRASVYRVLEA